MMQGFRAEVKVKGEEAYILGSFGTQVLRDMRDVKIQRIADNPMKDMQQVKEGMMQAAADAQDGCMAAVLGLEDEAVEQACREAEGVVLPVNYNCPGQLVIAGERQAVDAAAERCRAAGARRIMPLAVSGAFHTPLIPATMVPFLTPSTKPASSVLRNPGCLAMAVMAFATSIPFMAPSVEFQVQ